MSIYELRDLAILIAFTVVPAVIASLLISKFRTHWSRRRAVLLAALPVPAIVWILCLYLFVLSASASKEECGVDACGMMIMAATYVSLYALFAYGAGTAAAWLTLKLVNR